MSHGGGGGLATPPRGQVSLVTAVTRSRRLLGLSGFARPNDRAKTERGRRSRAPRRSRVRNIGGELTSAGRTARRREAGVAHLCVRSTRRPGRVVGLARCRAFGQRVHEEVDESTGLFFGAVLHRIGDAAHEDQHIVGGDVSAQAAVGPTPHRYTPSPEPCCSPRRAMTGVIPTSQTCLRYSSWSSPRSACSASGRCRGRPRRTRTGGIVWIRGIKLGDVVAVAAGSATPATGYHVLR